MFCWWGGGVQCVTNPASGGGGYNVLQILLVGGVDVLEMPC